MTKDFVECDGVEIYVRKPINTINVPVINHPNLVSLTDNQAEVDEFFNAYDDESLRVYLINGIYTSCDSLDMYFCDYCESEIVEAKYTQDNAEHFLEYFRCYDCHRNMCSSCHEAINQSDSTASECVDHVLERRNLFENMRPECNQCEEYVPEASIVYSNNILSENGKHICIETCNADEQYNLCENCADECIELIKIHNLVPWRYHMGDNKWYGFGSMLDWYPIARDIIDQRSPTLGIDRNDRNGGYILFNYNADSPYCGDIALLTSDDHCRSGFYRTTCTLSKIIEYLSAPRIIDRKNPGKSDSEDMIGGEHVDLKKTITNLMEELGMDVYYG